MSAELESPEYFHRKLDCAIRQIRRNVSSFSPDDLEKMVREKLIDAKSVPPDLRTHYVRRRLGLRK